MSLLLTVLQRLEPTLSLRFAGVSQGAKIDLVACAAKAPSRVRIALQLEDHCRVEADVSSASSLWQMLEVFEAQQPKQLEAAEETDAVAVAATGACTQPVSDLAAAASDGAARRRYIGYQGTPAPEKNSLFTLQINLVGYMQPVIDFASRRVDTDSALRSTTLADLGLTS